MGRSQAGVCRQSFLTSWSLVFLWCPLFMPPMLHRWLSIHSENGYQLHIHRFFNFVPLFYFFHAAKKWYSRAFYFRSALPSIQINCVAITSPIAIRKDCFFIKRMEASALFFLVDIFSIFSEYTGVAAAFSTSEFLFLRFPIHFRNNPALFMVRRPINDSR